MRYLENLGQGPFWRLLLGLLLPDDPSRRFTKSAPNIFTSFRFTHRFPLTMKCSSDQLVSCVTADRSIKVEAAVDTIAAMCRQELSAYATVDVFQMEHVAPLDVDAECRKKMAAWMYQVVDFCKFTRESAEIALSCLDRFLTTASGLRALDDRSVFQLSAMTALYTAVKIHEPEAMDPSLVSSLSRGVYSSQDIEQMEYILLHALNWRVNPPTTMSFVREFLNLIPAEAMDKATREIVYELTKLQTELAVADNAIVGAKPSTIAYCSFMNALDSLHLDAKIVQFVGLILQEAIGVSDCFSKKVEQVQGYLLSAVVGHPLLAGSTKSYRRTSRKELQSPHKRERRSPKRTISPRSIVMYTTQAASQN